MPNCCTLKLHHVSNITICNAADITSFLLGVGSWFKPLITRKELALREQILSFNMLNGEPTNLSGKQNDSLTFATDWSQSSIHTVQTLIWHHLMLKGLNHVSLDFLQNLLLKVAMKLAAHTVCSQTLY